MRPNFFPLLHRFDRSHLYHAANFLLPDGWSQGTVDFQVVVRDTSGNSDTSEIIPIHFTCKREPIYWVVPLNTGSESEPILPFDAQISTAEDYLETIYPVVAVQWVRKPWKDIGTTTIDDTMDDLRDYYWANFWTWLELLLLGSPPFEFPEQIVGFFYGDEETDSLADNIYGKVARVNARGDSSMAHEINHNLGAGANWGSHVYDDCGTAGAGKFDLDWPYTDEGIQEVGFDTRVPWDENELTQTALASDVPDLMSYCHADAHPTKWISPYRWEALFDRIPNASPCAVVKPLSSNPTMAHLDSVRQVMYLSGELNQDGTGLLRPAFVQPGILNEKISEADYSLVMLNIQGQILNKTPFSVSFLDMKGRPQNRTHFYLQLPVIQTKAVAQIQLRRGAAVLDRIMVSEHPPSVDVEEVYSNHPLSGKQTVRWTAHDTDNDHLEFFVFYSADDGRVWRPIASRVRTRSLTLNFDQVPGGHQARIRVMASDGYHTSQDESEVAFPVARKRPEAMIKGPRDKVRFKSAQLIQLAGRGFDLEDGSLPQDRLVWTLNDRPIGIGRRLRMRLPDGSHTVSLNVVDEDGLQHQTSVLVYVGPPTQSQDI